MVLRLSHGNEVVLSWKCELCHGNVMALLWVCDSFVIGMWRLNYEDVVVAHIWGFGDSITRMLWLSHGVSGGSSRRMFLCLSYGDVVAQLCRCGGLVKGIF
jgi:hypothetical protein